MTAFTRTIATTLLTLASRSVQADLSVSGTQLLDGNGNAFVMRGVNVPHAWFSGQTDQSLQDIATLGANTVRIVLSNGAQWNRTPASEVANIISRAKSEELITTQPATVKRAARRQCPKRSITGWTFRTFCRVKRTM